MARATLAFGTVLLFAALCTFTADAQPPSYLEHEIVPARPLALSSDGSRLFVTNTPDAHLEIFDLSGELPVLEASVPVGLAPVAVAVESDARVWVVNHLSDSVSVVDVASDPPRVIATLLVGDEPTDIVFAGPDRSQAFVAAAHRGQNTIVPYDSYATPGIGRADVWVFDAATLGSAPLEVLTFFGDKPRALATTPDGSRVFVAVLLSGNMTTTLGEPLVCDGGPLAPPCTIAGVPMPGGMLGPRTNAQGTVAPEVGLVVQFDPLSGLWRDESGRDWSGAVRFDLPDLDVFELDTSTATPVAGAEHAHVGTVLYGMAVNPTTGALYVANTEARNLTRFEGLGDHVAAREAKADGVPLTVRGHLHEARITVVDGAAVSPVHLNPHIDYSLETPPAGTRERSIATPVAIDVSADGSTAYVAAFGSSAVAALPTAALEAGTVATDAERLIPLASPGPVGPAGLVVDDARGRLYVLTRFDDALVTVDLDTRAVLARDRLHTAEPAEVVLGRPFLYEASFSSSNGEASCGSCHVFGDFDGLTWDLGDPDGTVTATPNPVGEVGSALPFHPMKGPMSTQSLRGLADQGPMHWRGDRTGGLATPAGDPLDEVAAFEQFNPAFFGLLGRAEGVLPADEMNAFARFATSIVYPPNPIRALDNSLRTDEANGLALYDTMLDEAATCRGCHALDRASGFFGADGRTTFEGETQEFKVAHLRNAYQKVGMFGILDPAPFFFPSGDEHTGDQIRGTGFLHDGAVDTVFRFLHANLFLFETEEARRDMEAFVMAFDTTLAPITGQQITLDSTNAAEVAARIDLLLARAREPFVWPGGATVRECDLVVHGVVGGEPRGYLYDGVSTFLPDRAGDAALTEAELRALAETPGQELTFTCAAPGSGERSAQDRDEDGVLDGDERTAGTPVAMRPFTTIPALVIVPAPTPRDGGCSVAAGALTDGTRACYGLLLAGALLVARRSRRGGGGRDHESNFRRGQ